MRRFTSLASTVALFAGVVLTSVFFELQSGSAAQASLRQGLPPLAINGASKPHLKTGTTVERLQQIAESPSLVSQEAYIKASNTGISDTFGQAIALSGDTLVVGAPNESSNAIGVNGSGTNDNSPLSGAAYVFIRVAGVWTQQAYLKPSNTGMLDSFGSAVAISGDTIVVGAPYEDSSATGINGNGAINNAPDSGAAYVFVRTGGAWTQQAYLKASNTGTGDRFGYSVGVSGDTVVVGADSEDSGATGVNGSGANDNAPNSGAGYVFFRTSGVWAQQAYLKASNTGMDDEFGWSIAISGDTVIVGAPYEDSIVGGINGGGSDNASEGSGAAYALVRSGVTWNQQAYMKAPHPDVDDFFGYSVAVSGNTAVVGAVNEDSGATGVNGDDLDGTATDSGAAFVFVVAGGSWSQQAYLKASNTGEREFFGNAVSISGDMIVIGAPYENSPATGVNGNGLDNSSPDAGAAYQFQRTSGDWSQLTYLKASNTDLSDRFGFAVAASSFVAIGAVGESSAATGINGNQADNSAATAGATYVFTEGGQQSRSVSVGGASIPAGSNGTTSVVFISRGNENSVAFSLNFDTTRLAYVSAAAGGSLPGGSSVVINSSQVLSGRVGVTLTLPAGQSLVAGQHQVLSLTLTALSNAPQGATQVTFGDTPVARSFVQPNGTPVPIDQVVFNSGNVMITPPLVVRNVRVVGATIQPGTSGSVVVQIDAQGSENALAFSLIFDTTKLNYISASPGGVAGASLNVNTSLVGSGHLGFSFDLPAGQALPQGTQSIVSVVFGVPPGTGGTTEIAFSDSPTTRRLVDTTDSTLPAAYTNGNVTLDATGFEADTSPRPNGNGVVSLIDWVQTGRFAVGLDTVAVGSEYQRADCAPRETKGNGQLSLADWVQAGRFGSGLDPVVSAGGPTAPVPFTESAAVALETDASGRGVRSLRVSSEARSITIASSVSKLGIAHAEVRIEAEGVENAISLGLLFDPDEWQIVDVRPGGDALNATLIFKSSVQGSVVLALALPPGQAVARGTRTLIDVTLTRRSTRERRVPGLRLLEDRQIKFEVVDAFGNSLPRRFVIER